MKNILSILLLCFCFSVTAQTVRINEAVSSNSFYIDEDGDTPDWIELYNYGSQHVNLENWTISDDETDLLKWSFPNVSIPPNDYLLLWASAKDRAQITTIRTLVNQGDLYNYLIPSSEPNSNWTNLNFNDSTWANGSSGFGYADGDDATLIPNGTVAVYLRKKFNLNNAADVMSLILDIDYDDAFVAYINGVEVARANINGVPPSYNASTNQDHEAQMYSGGSPDRFTIADFSSILTEGENILAIQAHNISQWSSDFTIIPFLSATFASANNSGVAPPEILNLNGNNAFHTNFKISTNSETLSLSNDTGMVVDQLVVEGLPPDASIGVSSSSGNVVSFIQTTPGSQNSGEEFLGTVQNELVFSEIGGVKDAPLSLSLSGNSVSQLIHYTTDGSSPNSLSQIYTAPLQLSTNTSVRAQIYSTDYLPSPVVTESYIFNSNHDIDVMLLSVDPFDFFDDDFGIYVAGPEGTYDESMPYFGANFWEDWERPIHFSFYENNSDAFVEFNAGVKIFGGWSRGQNGQRSLSFFARGKYGDSKFEHSFFDQLTYNDFESFTIRNSGQDWLRSNMKDIMLTSLMRGSELDFQEYNPVATYINGDYWGMYNMREKINEHMLASKHNVDAERISLLTFNAEVIEGDNEEYIELIEYIENTDLTDDSNFEFVEERVDLKNYALYQATNIYINNTDWPGNNIKFWKHPDTKWRWVMYDTDFGFGPFWNISNYYENTLSFALNPDGPGWPNPPWSTLLFRKMTTNIGFRNQFINRYADELNTRFLPANLLNHIDQIYATIESEVPAHFTRWKDDPTLGYEITDISAHVDYYIANMKSFGLNRHAIVKEHIKEQFNLPNFHPLTITNLNLNEGYVAVNENINIQEPTWTGDYFETVPVKLTAITQFGYEFSHWSGDLFSNNETIEVLLTESFEVVPNFTPTETTIPLVINEINYKSIDTFDTDDWIELYNPNSAAIDLTNWELKDDDDTHVFAIPDGTQIEGEGFLVLVKDETNFSSVLPEVPYVGELNFGFGGSDAVRLYDPNGTLQDEVDYQSLAPWPSCADASGYTLELRSPDLDNALPENWACINLNGSPNFPNDPGSCESGWEVIVTEQNHAIFVSGPWLDINGDSLTEGALLGVFYENGNGELLCAGYTEITSGTSQIEVMGDAAASDAIDGLTPGQELVFQIWDSLSCEVFAASPVFTNGPEVFTNNGVSFIGAVQAEFFGPSEQIINIPMGWSMFSTYIIAENMDLASVLAPIVEDIRIVKDFNGSAYITEWNFNGIGLLEVGQGYQIKTGAEVSLQVSGDYAFPESHPITLTSGWNIIGYLRDEPANAASVFSEINESGNLVIVKDYIGNAYLPEWSFNGIGNLISGRGYQLKMFNDDVLNYLPNNQTYRFGSVGVTQKNLYHFIEKTPTDNNMTLVIEEAAWDKAPVNGSEIAVFDRKGKIVGSGVYTKPVTVLCVWGDDALTSAKEGLSVSEEVNFKLWNTNTTQSFSIDKWRKGSSSYQANTISIASSIVTDNTIMNSSNRTLVRLVNLLGQEINMDEDQFEGGMLFEIYNDGTVEKVIRY